jgi:hypothetical protein
MFQKREMEELAEQVRRGPPLLSSLHKKLQIDSTREEAKHPLHKLCNDAYAASTIGPRNMKPTNNSQLAASNSLMASTTRHPAQHLHPFTAARSRVSTTQGSSIGGQQGEEFGFG